MVKGQLGGYGGDDRVSRERGEIGQEPLEAVDGQAVGGSVGGLLGDGFGRALRLSDGALSRKVSVRKVSAACLSSSS
jgi:hypothetical protein